MELESPISAGLIFWFLYLTGAVILGIAFIALYKFITMGSTMSSRKKLWLTILLVSVYVLILFVTLIGNVVAIFGGF